MALISYPYTVNDAAAAAISGVNVWATSDIDGKIIMDGPEQTNASGIATLTLENASDVYIWLGKVGYVPDVQPDLQTVAIAGATGTMTAETDSVPDTITVTTTVRDLIEDVFSEVNVLPDGGSLDNDKAQYGLRRLNMMLEQWRIQRRLCFKIGITQYSLTTTGSAYYTLGPTGDFVGRRPIWLERVKLVISGVHYPVGVIRNEKDWADIPNKTVTSSIPAYVYCDYSHPNARLYFHPVPSSAVTVEIHDWEQLSKFPNLDTQITLPEGYYEGLMLSLCEKLFSRFGVPMEIRASIMVEATKARALISSHNAVIPDFDLIDAGVPNHSESDYDYMTGNFPV